MDKGVTANMASAPPDTAAAADRKELVRVRKLATILDSQFTLPGGFRVGADGLIGLIPGVGDLVSGGLSLWIVAKARQIGVPKRKLGMMVARVGLDSTLGAVPVIGDMFDFFYKANLKNTQVLVEHLEKRSRSEEPLSVAGYDQAQGNQS